MVDGQGFMGIGVETVPEEESGEQKIKWKDYLVAVFGASAEDNMMAIKNSKAAGRLLAEQGYDAINGGYAVGGMGAMAEGYADACQEVGMNGDQIKNHLNGLTSPEFADRQVNPQANIKEMASMKDRLQALVEGSDAYIATEGGKGTVEEVITALKAEKSHSKEDSEHIAKPVIIIDNEHLALKTLLENQNVQMGDITPDTFYILSGKTAEERAPGQSIHDLETIPNSLPGNEQMAEQTRLILEYHYLLKQNDAESAGRINELKKQLFDPSSGIQVLTLDDIIRGDKAES